MFANRIVAEDAGKSVYIVIVYSHAAELFGLDEMLPFPRDRREMRFVRERLCRRCEVDDVA
jgi:hypothetical protein